MPDCEIALPDPGEVSELNNSASPHRLPRLLCCQKTSPAGANQSEKQYKRQDEQTVYDEGNDIKVLKNKDSEL